jgi:hypothetical protein
MMRKTIADIVAAIDEGGDGCFVHDGDGDAGVPGLRLTRDREDARQPSKGWPSLSKRRNQGETLGDIARSYNVSPATISRLAE